MIVRQIRYADLVVRAPDDSLQAFWFSEGIEIGVDLDNTDNCYMAIGIRMVDAIDGATRAAEHGFIERGSIPQKECQ